MSRSYYNWLVIHDDGSTERWKVIEPMAAIYSCLVQDDIIAVIRMDLA